MFQKRDTKGTFIDLNRCPVILFLHVKARKVLRQFFQKVTHMGQRTMLFRPDTNVYTPAYLLYAIASDRLKRQAGALNAGSAAPHVNVKDTKRFRTPPSNRSAKEFAAFVAQVDKSKAAVRSAIEKLELLKASLMQEYFG